MVYAPIVANIDGRLQIAPMRYTCRLGGKPANYDARYPGTNNARRDNLGGFWSEVYGKNHAVMVVSGFYENVPRHLYEKRELKPDEKAANMVLQFNPRPVTEMLVACLWDHWSGPSATDLWSFAAVTDEPPPEIAETGHQRCIIALREENAREWLSPAGVSRERFEAILSDKEMPYYEHRVAA
jgi:putative SOS response-associated peptidase YedK